MNVHVGTRYLKRLTSLAIVLVLLGMASPALASPAAAGIVPMADVSSFQMSTASSPQEGQIIILNDSQVTFQLSSAYSVNAYVELWAEDGSWAASPQSASMDGVNDQYLTFSVPPTNLRYRITLWTWDNSWASCWVRIESA